MIAISKSNSQPLTLDQTCQPTISITNKLVMATLPTKTLKTLQQRTLPRLTLTSQRSRRSRKEVSRTGQGQEFSRKTCRKPNSKNNDRSSARNNPSLRKKTQFRNSFGPVRQRLGKTSGQNHDEITPAPTRKNPGDLLKNPKERTLNRIDKE
ncbi:hypothetical protein F2Q69_00043880 [Brassica cretica]|uniref:Uncharacterized protein n=1 Tax=Brassica cretica TaxID=69181 RepID=A0A8S9NT76_BRACR|nr:hypothetical protein F2Q69_00043880 [Brassica cretica]